MAEIIGELKLRDSRAFIWNGNHEVDLFSWLASHGLRNKLVYIKATEATKEADNVYTIEYEVGE
jgi:hypothetical protein